MNQYEQYASDSFEIECTEESGMDWTHRFIYKKAYIEGMKKQREIMQEELDRLNRAYENASNHRQYYVYRCVMLNKEIDILKHQIESLSIPPVNL
jgi:hypothetical protein